MASKNKELAILNATTLRAAVKRRRTADVECYCGTVRVRSWSLAEVTEWDARHKDVPEEEAFQLLPEMVARSWVDGDGEPLAPVDEGTELARDLDTDDLKTLAVAIMRLNGRNVDAVEEAEKNSEASRNESTSTGSPETSDTPTPT